MDPAFIQAELFEGLPESALSEVVARFQRRSFARDEQLFNEGEPATSFFLIASGKVKVVQTSVEGTEVILQVFRPGQLIGALAVLGEGTYPATSIALSDGVVYRISAESFEELLLLHPQVTLNLLRFATHQLQVAHRRLRELATERVERRIARAISRLASQIGKKAERGITLDAPLTRQDLAELSGTTLYTVSRTLKNWERQGILLTKREQVTILDPHALIVIAEDLPETDRPS
ncbi:MAG: cyclic nucleotide-binding domain-containing protein [Anaerolineae bacterium]|nr:cyclic nucleotide-binding domain-containing protein [Anaerolineae bacterium]NIN96126.1 cyclic nucleotide-binding domain-containing protein [Anaerolineae bacterium]